MEISSPHLSFFLCFLFSVHISLFPSCSLHLHFSLPLTRVERLLYVCISCSRSLGALGPAHRERGGAPPLLKTGPGAGIVGSSGAKGLDAVSEAP